MTCGRSLPGEGLSLLGFFDMATAVSSIHTSRLSRLAGFSGQWPVLARGTPTPPGTPRLRRRIAHTSHVSNSLDLGIAGGNPARHTVPAQVSGPGYAVRIGRGRSTGSRF